MIVKDEEDVLARCLESAKGFADEIIIVDTGSEDRTKQIAFEYTDKVFDFEWIDDFSAARNFSFSKATMDFIMWLDADDVVEGENPERIKAIKQTIGDTTDVAMLRYNVAFDEYDRPTVSFNRERILRRSMGLLWHEPIHECIVPSGRIVTYDIAISHRKQKTNDRDRNLRIFNRLKKSGAKMSPRLKYYFGRELYYHKQYTEAIATLENFCADKGGFRQNQMEACLMMSYSYTAIGDKKSSFDALLKSLGFGSPCAEICCEIGAAFFARNDFEAAMFWYKSATMIKPKLESGAILHLEYYDFFPNIWLCVCCERLGDRENAIAYNEIAASFKPDDPAVKNNRLFFAQTSARTKDAN